MVVWLVRPFAYGPGPEPAQTNLAPVGSLQRALLSLDIGGWVPRQPLRAQTAVPTRLRTSQTLVFPALNLAGRWREEAIASCWRSIEKTDSGQAVRNPFSEVRTALPARCGTIGATHSPHARRAGPAGRRDGARPLPPLRLETHAADLHADSCGECTTHGCRGCLGRRGSARSGPTLPAKMRATRKTPHPKWRQKAMAHNPAAMDKGCFFLIKLCRVRLFSSAAPTLETLSPPQLSVLSILILSSNLGPRPPFVPLLILYLEYTHTFSEMVALRCAINPKCAVIRHEVKKLHHPLTACHEAAMKICLLPTDPTAS
uniref:Uncharacterized protein LOC116942901 n=1 Tax=Petromyzon marinus TaxID=7757 RepID=A0AAJ7WVD6_PETMA|nr:uncharacterized protein LOC116942901 [Petromyzon marinus]